MPYRISSGVASIAAQRHLGKSQREVDLSLKRLASGTRLVNAADDAAGFAIAETLRGQSSGLKQAGFNAEAAQAFVQTAEGGLSEQNNILVRMRELAVLSASDTIGDEEREFINKEFDQLQQEIDRIAQGTRFGDKRLLVGSGEKFEFHVGAHPESENTISFELLANTSGDELGVSGLDILDQDDARGVLDTLDEAIYKVSDARATFGAAQSRFQFVVDNLSIQRENIDSARSIIADTDVAAEVSNLTKHRILQEMGTSVLAQANTDVQRALKLINF